jgi:hypothetical protein
MPTISELALVFLAAAIAGLLVVSVVAELRRPASSPPEGAAMSLCGTYVVAGTCLGIMIGTVLAGLVLGRRP